MLISHDCIFSLSRASAGIGGLLNGVTFAILPHSGNVIMFKFIYLNTLVKEILHNSNTGSSIGPKVGSTVSDK
jgi:hypothetical protein